MGVGYIIGCLFSILLWKFDRQKFLNKIYKNIRVSKGLFTGFIFIALCISLFFVEKFKFGGDVYNFITVFCIIDISNTERKNLNRMDKMHFYNSISFVSKSLISGFIAPLFYVLVLGNYAGILYSFVYNINSIENFKPLEIIFNILNIIPSIIGQIFLYIIFVVKNKSFKIDFKQDYFTNMLLLPLLNVDIIGAYIEKVNFYFYYDRRDVHYLKSYGEYSKKIDEKCIKNYWSMSYGICFICFLVFCFLIIK